MREILFRGKRIDNGKWVEGDLIRSEGKTYCGIYADTLKQVDPLTIGQFTGLTDKNGKKIFEGDILGRDNHWRLIVEPLRIMPLNKVQYNNSKGISLNEFESEFWEVVGNIHNKQNGGE